MAEIRARDKAEIKRTLCERIAGGESVNAIFIAGGVGIGERTFWRWIAADKDFREAYEVATGLRAEKYAEEIVQIGDEEPRYVSTQFGSHVDAGFEQWRRTRVDARKWVAARLAHKRYGDRTVIAGDAENPLVVDDYRGELLRRLGADTPETKDSGMDRDTLQ